MSIVTEIVDKLKNIDPSDLKAEVDRSERVTVNNISFDPLDSIESRAVVVTLNYTRKDGSTHTIKVQTRFQRHDDDNKINVDGKEMTNVVVDPDLMGLTPQLEFRYNDPFETDEAAPDNEVTFQAGGGNHEFRIIA